MSELTFIGKDEIPKDTRTRGVSSEQQAVNEHFAALADELKNINGDVGGKTVLPVPVQMSSESAVKNKIRRLTVNALEQVGVKVTVKVHTDIEQKDDETWLATDPTVFLYNRG